MISVLVDLPDKKTRDSVVMGLSARILEMKTLPAEEEATVPDYCSMIKQVDSWGVRVSPDCVSILINPSRLMDDDNFKKFIRSIIFNYFS